MADRSEARPAPPLAMPPRPARPLSMLELLRVLPANSLAACDEALFDELIVERRLLGRRFFIVSDPDGIKRVMRDNVDNYPRIEPIRRLFHFSAGSGLVSAEGDPWRRHRRLLNPTLDHRAILAHVPVMIDLAGQLAGHLARLPPHQEIDIGETFAHLMTAFSGRVFAANEREIDPVLYRLGQYPGRYSLLDFVPMPRWLRPLDGGRRSRARTQEFHPLLDQLLEARRREDYSGEQDLLWRLANARDRETGKSLNAAELRDEALTLGATSATPLRLFPWIWYLLAMHPWAEAQLHAELDEMLGGAVPRPDQLFKLGFLRKLVDETMRLYPPAPTMLRSTLADDQVCGRKVPRKSVVAIMPWIVHRHRKLWQDPDHFDPDRFTPERVAARSRYAYLPFSIGPHVCVGASLAMMQMVVAVAVLAQRFRFRLVPGHPVEPTAWINLRPRGGIRMTLEPRARKT